MLELAAAISALPLVIWSYLMTARGAFWREPQRLGSDEGRLRLPSRRIVAIVPARDEAEVIGAAVESLLRQRLDGSLQVIVVDDGSTDGTAAAARDAAEVLGASSSLTVSSAAPLPRGWTGKLWALSQGVRAAAALEPDYLLFTDADIHHDPESVAALLARAETGGYDLVSSMVTLSTATLAEKALIPAFVFFFFMLYPPKWIASPRSRTAGAAGGCMLIRPRALERCGGLAAVRSEIIDDCSLAAAVKASGGRVSLSLTRHARSIRSYGSFRGVGRMISRSAFNQLRHSYALLAATLAGLAVTFVLPPLLIATARPIPALLGASAWALMSVAYRPMVRFYRLGPLWSLSLPAVAVFYGGATLRSALDYRSGRGGRWKNRIQDRCA